MELRLGSIPLHIRGQFFLMALFLGMSEGDPAKLAIWAAVVLVSVVVHELGHALMGKAFGLMPRIELHGMGGHTFFTGPAHERGELGPKKQIAISVAGPFAGFLFALALFLAQLAGLHPAHPLARHAVALLYIVNVVWGVFNLLPMLPLDGGNVLRAIAQAIAKDKGEKIARIVSIVVAVGIAAWSVRRGQWWVLYLGVLYGFQNVQAIRQAGKRRVDQMLVEAIENGHRALDRNAHAEAIALLRPVLAGEGSAELRQVGLRIYLVAMLREGLWHDAMSVIERESVLIGAEDLARYAQAMRDLGRQEDAARLDRLASAPAPLSEFRA